MTPAEFAGTYRPTADVVSAGTLIDPIALLSQWANETGWGTSWAGAPFNLGNIESNGKVILYTSLAAFAQACIQTFHNGLYDQVLLASNAVDQLAAIVASPWAAGHYGGSLMAEYNALEGYELTPEEHQRQINIEVGVTNAYAGIQNIFNALTGQQPVPTPPGVNIKAELDAIKAGLGGGGTVDLTPVIGRLDRIIAELHTP